MTKQRLAIVIPTYNERENIQRLILSLQEVLPEAKLIFVDDASPDGTGKLLNKISKKNENIKVLHRPYKMGLGTAYVLGFKEALRLNCDVIVEMDADLSHRPNEIPNLLNALEESDLALGSRYIQGGKIKTWSPLRRIVSKGGALYSRLILGIKIRDLTTGFKAIKREVLQSIDLDSLKSRGFSFQIELTYHIVQKGFKIKEVPITFDPRSKGKSKFSFGIIIEALFMILKLRWNSIKNKWGLGKNKG
jgi:dolichol-phosphate mannosyltransferase